MGLFMSPGHKEDMQQKQHRGQPHTSEIDPELASVIDAVIPDHDAEEEPMPMKSRGISVSQANSVPQDSKSSDCPRQESRDIVSESDSMRQPSAESLTSFMSSCAGTSDKSFDFPSRNVSEILSFMLNHKKDANVQATALRALTNFIVPGGVDGPVGICGGQTGAGQPGCGRYGAWAEIQSIVAEAGVIEVSLAPCTCEPRNSRPAGRDRAPRRWLHPCTPGRSRHG